MQNFQSNHREDALLNRLKQCVGQIEGKRTQNVNKSFNNPVDKYQTSNIKSKYLQKQNSAGKSYNNKYEQNQENLSYRFVDKENVSSKKCYVRQRDHRASSSLKPNYQKLFDLDKIQSSYSKKQSEQNSFIQYRTNRKESTPLTDCQNVINIRKNSLQLSKGNQNKQYDLFLNSVSQSTRKRIAQRQSLIRDQSQKVTPTKRSQNLNTSLNTQNKKTDNQYLNEQDEFLQRLSLRRKQYGRQRDQLSTNIKYEQEYSKRQQPKFREQNPRLKPQNLDITQKISFKFAQSKQLQIQKINPSKRLDFNSKKYNIETLRSQNEYKKSQKMQKLKKITQMNEQINNKIRKIVDNFQSYLTHRQVA